MEKNWEVITTEGTAEFELNFWCKGTFHIVASSQGINSAYSEAFISPDNDICSPLTITINKISVLVNEPLKVSLYTQWSIEGVAISCHYRIVDSHYEMVYGNSVTSSIVEE